MRLVRRDANQREIVDALQRAGCSVWERFWSKVDVLENAAACWLWIGCRARNGYGKFGAGGRGGRTMSAHRVAFELAAGAPIPDGLFVLHRCDNPPCVNPSHLFLGTNSDNMLDASAKGHMRVPRGSDSPFSKLDASKVELIRRLHSAGRSKASLAREHGICVATVTDVVGRKTWKWTP